MTASVAIDRPDIREDVAAREAEAREFAGDMQIESHGWPFGLCHGLQGRCRRPEDEGRDESPHGDGTVVGTRRRGNPEPRGECREGHGGNRDGELCRKSPKRVDGAFDAVDQWAALDPASGIDIAGRGVPCQAT